MGKLLSVKEAAELLSCSEAAIRKWLYQGQLPYVKVGRLTRLRSEDIERVASIGLNGGQQQAQQRPCERLGRP